MPKGVGGKLVRQFTRRRSEVPVGVRKLYGHFICSAARRALEARERVEAVIARREKLRGRAE